VRIVCILGQHNYGDPSLGVSPEYRSFIPALQKLGHEIIHIESWDRSRFESFFELNRWIIQTVLEKDPDLIFAVPFQHELWLETFDIISKTSRAKSICWSTDDSWKYRECSRYLGKHFDLMLTTYASKIDHYRRDGIENILLTQWGIAEDELQTPIPANDCHYGVTFVGAAHGSRSKMVEYFKASGIPIECFGNGWPRGSVSSTELRQIIRESIVSLNFSNSTGENQIKARTFEVPGLGGCLLTQSASDLTQFLEVGRECEEFRNLPEAVRKCRELLANASYRDQMAALGYARVKANHTYERRFSEIISRADQLPSKHLQNVDTDRVLREFDRSYQNLPLNTIERAARKSLTTLCTLAWGQRRGQRAARKIVYECCWRLQEESTYSSQSIVGRWFYREPPKSN